MRSLNAEYSSNEHCYTPALHPEISTFYPFPPDVHLQALEPRQEGSRTTS